MKPYLSLIILAISKTKIVEMKHLRIKTDTDDFIHFDGCITDYTLCGLDVHGDSSIGIGKARVVDSLVNCPHCVAIVKHCWNIKNNDLSRKNRLSLSPYNPTKSIILILFLAICLNASAQESNKGMSIVHFVNVQIKGDTIYCDTTTLVQAKAQIDFLQRSLDYQRLEYNMLKERYDIMIRERKRRNK